MLDLEFQYFLDNQEKWSIEHFDKYAVVESHSVFGFFDTEIEAYNSAMKVLKPGTFCIQHCIPGPESYTQKFALAEIVHVF